MQESNIISDKKKERLYNQFINMCLIDTTDSFIKKKYKLYLKKQNRNQKSKFYERMQHDIKDRKVIKDNLNQFILDKIKHREAVDNTEVLQFQRRCTKLNNSGLKEGDPNNSELYIDGERSSSVSSTPPLGMIKSGLSHFRAS